MSDEHSSIAASQVKERVRQADCHLATPAEANRPFARGPGLAMLRDRVNMANEMQTIVRLHKFSRWLLEQHLPRLARLVERLIRLIYAARIPAEADIDPTVHFSHNALAVVVTKRATIGARCQIGLHVLLGSRWPLEGGPTLEEDVIVHSGARIIGPITIGRGSVIGANAVVLKNVPPRSLVVGVPGVVKKSDIRIEDYLPQGPAED
jgi:serine O-acetyltransferase